MRFTEKYRGTIASFTGYVLGAVVMFVSMSCDAVPVPVVGCALQDEKLSIAFKDPVRARAYLKKLGERLKNGEPDAIREAGELTASVAECLK